MGSNGTYLGKFKIDYKNIMFMLDKLIPIVLYDSEILGWKERETKSNKDG